MDMNIESRIEEHVYRLERDEAKMLARLKHTNLHATGIEKFLTRGDKENKDVTMDSLIDKKRIIETKKVIALGAPVKVSTLDTTTLTFQLTKGAKIDCSYTVSHNSFTQMPKGQIKLTIIG